MAATPREGSLQAPTRYPIGQDEPGYYDENEVFAELERVFDICHGCRRCVNLCNTFPTLFDLVDESITMEIDGVDKADYWKVVDQCYLCDLCYVAKCPYVPPHEWNIDFPHLMLRAKALGFKQGRTKIRDRLITSTDRIGQFASIPIVVNMVNAFNKNKFSRRLLESAGKIDSTAKLPQYHSDTLSKRTRMHNTDPGKALPDKNTNGKVAIFGTCYGEYNEPHLGEDLIAVLEHNEIPVQIIQNTVCCGMPKLEIGDFDSVSRLKERNIPTLLALVEDGWDIISPVPSCTLQFKQELPVLFPNDKRIARVQQSFYDPFEYLMLRHKAELLKTDFKNTLGKISYHVACHQRVQRIGAKTRDILSLIPNTKIEMIERCSGHNGTYAIKQEHHQSAIKICRPVANRIEKFEPDVYTSDCPMAGHHIAAVLNNGSQTEHPISLLKRAYNI